MKRIRPLLLAIMWCACVHAQPNQPVTLNFVNADVETVIRAIGEMTGRNFIIDPRVKGSVNIISAQPVTRELAYQILLSSLRLQGFSAVESNGVTKILPEADAKWHAHYGKNRSGDGERLITQVFTLKHSSAVQLLPVIRPIVAPNHAVTAHAQANALVVTDYADNLRRIEAIIASLEGGGTIQTAMVPLLYASAPELATTLEKILQESGSDGIKTRISADARANVLLVRAETAGRLAQVKSLVKRLDQPSQAGANVRVVYLKNADAVRVAQTLRALLSSSAAPLSATQRSALPSSPAASGLTGGNTVGASDMIAAGDPLPESTERSTATEGPASGGAAANLIQADSSSNALILNVPDGMYRNLRAVIDQLDRRRAQVHVETLVMEVSAQRMQELGVQWQSLAGLGRDGARLVGSSSFNAAGMPAIQNSDNAGFATFSSNGLNIGISRGTLYLPKVGEVANLAFLARALETEADGNVLSSPNLMATDNEKARIEVGQEISVLSGQYANSGSGSGNTVQPFSTYQRQKVGFKLEIVPQISEGGSIRMKIKQVASALAPGSRMANGVSNTTPDVNVRSVETAVTVEDGGIISIGGLIQELVSGSEDKIPFLGDLPLIGWLFRHRVKQRVKTNLLVFLKPTIVRNDLGARAIAEERYRYIIGEHLEQGTRHLPLDAKSALDSLPSGIKALAGSSGSAAP